MKKLHLLSVLISVLFSTLVSAQTYPYAEAFDSYASFSALNGNGGIVATSHIQVYPRGVNGSKCAEFQMTPFASPHYDSLTSPLIGPLTANTVASFYFRAVTYTGGTPLQYPMTSTDKVEVFVGNANFSISSSVYTITSANQNPAGAFVKVSLPVSSFAGISGKFRFVASNPSANDWVFELDSVVVADPSSTTTALSLSDHVTNAKCNGQSNGGIKVIASGGSIPYTYHWNTGSSLDSITTVAAGGYSVTVTDHLGATAILSDSVHQPAILHIDSISKTDPLCHGGNTGAATVHVSGGTGIDHFSWTPTGSTQTIQNLTGGVYQVVVTDANGCTTTGSASVTDPTALTATTSATPTNGSNGTATALASGGTSSYTYMWSTTPIQTTITATGLSVGTYHVTVTDHSGCTVIATATIVPNGIGDVNTLPLVIYPNPSREEVYIQAEGTIISLSVINLNGRIVYTRESSANNINISTLSMGFYIIKVKATSGEYVGRLTVGK